VAVGAGAVVGAGAAVSVAAGSGEGVGGFEVFVGAGAEAVKAADGVIGIAGRSSATVLTMRSEEEVSWHPASKTTAKPIIQIVDRARSIIARWLTLLLSWPTADS
jgi:hypothetical protein